MKKEHFFDKKDSCEITKDIFFESICSDCKTERDKIAAMIFARGYLIEEHSGRFGLGAREARLNERILNNELVRLNLGKVAAREVVIRDDATSEDAKKLFECERKNEPAEWPNSCTWEDLQNYCGEVDVVTTKLEPFIALYVRAINLCGVKTVGCCDGNHQGKHKAFLQFYGDPFRIWHEILCRFFLTPEISPKWTNGGRNLMFNSGTQFACYLSLFTAAKTLLANTKTIMEMKNEALSQFSPDELATTEVGAIRSRLTDEIIPDLLSKRNYLI